MINWLFDHLFSSELTTDDTPFLFQSDGQSINYVELEHVTAKFANALVALGLKPDDRVTVQIEKCSDALIIYLATIRAGGVFLPLNTAYVGSEVSYFLSDARPRIFICDPQREAELSEVITDSYTQLFTLNDEGKGSWITFCQEQQNSFKNIPRTADDMAAILYTSGTTGRSKGAVLTHNNLLSNAKALAKYWHYQSSDILLHALPVYHTHGLFVAVNITLITGAAMIFLKQFNVEDVLQYLPKATVMMGVPTFYTRLLSDDKLNEQLCSNMRLFISGSAPLLAEDHQRFVSRTGHVILERYGMTETNMNTSNPYEGERKAGTVGLPLPGVEIRIVDQQTGNNKDFNETGMIEVKGPNVFQAYWQMPDKTAEEFTDDGFFITGDLGVRDFQGYISIVGREKDLIISGGLNVYPKDVEQVINDCSCVSESAVIGIPDADLGEAVTAIVVCNAETFDKQLIISTIKKNLAGFKRPKQLFFVDKLPRNAMGKVQKNHLREIYSH